MPARFNYRCLLTTTQDQQSLQLVPLCNDSPNQSQEEYVVAENEPNNHLYSLGKFIHTGLHGRRLIVQSQNTVAATPTPAANTSAAAVPLPPRRVTVPSAGAAAVDLAEIREARSDSGTDNVTPLDSLVEVAALPEEDTLPPRSHTMTLPFSKPKQVGACCSQEYPWELQASSR